MKSSALISRAIAILALTAASSVFAVGSTNVIQNIGVQLTFLTQGSYRTNFPKTNNISSTVSRKVYATKDVIAWLGAATTNSFPPGAKLVFVKHVNSGGESSSIEVRYGTNRVDVSAFFANTTSSDEFHAATYNTVTRLTTGKTYEIFHLVLSNPTHYHLVPAFALQGGATVTYVTARVGSTSVSADTLSAPNLAGTGTDPDGNSVLVFGSLSVVGTQTEVR